MQAAIAVQWKFPIELGHGTLGRLIFPFSILLDCTKFCLGGFKSQVQKVQRDAA